jgi:hypothetical protein
VSLRTPTRLALAAALLGLAPALGAAGGTITGKVDVSPLRFQDETVVSSSTPLRRAPPRTRWTSGISSSPSSSRSRPATRRVPEQRRRRATSSRRTASRFTSASSGGGRRVHVPSTRRAASGATSTRRCWPGCSSRSGYAARSIGRSVPDRRGAARLYARGLERPRNGAERTVTVADGKTVERRYPSLKVPQNKRVDHTSS